MVPVPVILNRMKTHPVLIGIVNAIIPGLGYLLIKERVVFGWCMLVAFILFVVVTFIDPSPAFNAAFFSISPAGKILEAVAYVFALFAFGYDAYDMARADKGDAIPTF